MPNALCIRSIPFAAPSVGLGHVLSRCRNHRPSTDHHPTHQFPPVIARSAATWQSPAGTANHVQRRNRRSSKKRHAVKRTVYSSTVTMSIAGSNSKLIGSLRERFVFAESVSNRSSSSSFIRTDTILCPSSPFRAVFFVILFLLPFTQPSFLPHLSSGSVSEIKQPVRSDLQRIANIKDDIKRHRTIGCFNAAHMRTADIDQFSKRALR